MVIARIRCAKGLGLFRCGHTFSTSPASSKLLQGTISNEKKQGDEAAAVVVGKTAYKRDEWTNVGSRVLNFVGMQLHQQKSHPLSFTKQRIVKYMYSRFVNSRGNPLFSVHENLSPVVGTVQNFDTLNIPEDHPSRKMSDTYYVNADTVLRGHTSVHQTELIRSGLDNFLVVGDVYRKDEIDRCHYPVFHQVEAVRLRSRQQLFQGENEHLGVFEEGQRTACKQETHTLEAVKLMEHEMRTCLVGLMQHLFGNDVRCRWVNAFFPFTHPSFELEILHDGKWIEMLGCGIMEQNLLINAGADKKIGWAFGLGLERLAMLLYSIPDIRLFWTVDSGFHCQFKGKKADDPITFKPFSKCPQCYLDMSFWVPKDYSKNDFYEIARNIAGDMIEQIAFVDEFVHPKKQQLSHCYRLTYRHMERPLTVKEINSLHKKIAEAVTSQLGVEIR